MRHAGARSILRNTAFLLGAQTVTSVTRGGYAVFLASFLGPEIYGLFNYGVSWYLAFLPLCHFGLPAIVSRAIGRDPQHGRTLIGQVLRLRMLATACTAVLCLGLGWWTESSTQVRWLLFLFSLALAGRSIALLANGVFAAYEATRHTLRLEATFRLMEVTVGTLVLVSGGGLLAAATVHAAAWWGQGLVGLLVVRRHFEPVRTGWSRGAMLALLATGLPLGISEVLHAWLLQGPLVLFRHINGAGDALGYLALATQAFHILATVNWAVGSAGLPVLSRTVFRGDGKELLFVEVMLRVGLLFGSVAGLTALALGPALVALLFGPRYAETGTLLGLALWLLIPAAWTSALAHPLFAQGRVWAQVASSAAGAIMLTASMPVLATRFGARGALVATGLGFVTSAACLLLFFLRTNSINLGQALLRPLVSVALSLGTYLALRPAGPVLALSTALVVLAGGTLLLRVFSPEERSALGMLLIRRPGRAHESGEHTGGPA